MTGRRLLTCALISREGGAVEPPEQLLERLAALKVAESRLALASASLVLVFGLVELWQREERRMRGS